MVERLKERKILTNGQVNSFSEILPNYTKNGLTLWSFASALTDLISHPEQYSRRVRRSNIKVLENEHKISNLVNELPELLKKVA
jgi:hypothetical protein